MSSAYPRGGGPRAYLGQCRLRAVPIFPREFVEQRKDIGNAGALKPGQGGFPRPGFRAPAFAMYFNGSTNSRGKIGIARSVGQCGYIEINIFPCSGGMLGNKGTVIQFFTRQWRLWMRLFFIWLIEDGGSKRRLQEVVSSALLNHRLINSSYCCLLPTLGCLARSRFRDNCTRESR